MTDRGPYSRLYHSLVDDPHFDGVYADDAAFATWCRLLMIADASYPSLAPLPRTVRARPLAKLEAAGLVTVTPDGRFRLRGLEAERGRRSAVGRNAAMVRHHGPSNANAMQTQSERTANGLPRREETRKDEQGADAPNGAGTFMGFRGKGTHDGRHGRSCLVCFPAGVPS